MLSPFLLPLLIPPADAAVRKALLHGGPRSRKPSDEVSAVRSMTLDGFDGIAAGWSPILASHGLKIELQAVFCHSRPWVRFPRIPSPLAPAQPARTARCELADLLVVIDYQHPGAHHVDRRAVLVQAKMLKGGKIRPSGREWLQHELLAWLPSFQFEGSDYSSRPRVLAAGSVVGDPAMTAEYGGIDLAAGAWSQWLPETSKPCFTSPFDLAIYLAAMVTGNPNFGREAIPGGSDDWSFTVDELLRVTAAKPIVKKKANVLRGNPNEVGFVVNTAALDLTGAGAESSGGGADGGADMVEEWPEGAISTVHLIVTGIDEAIGDPERGPGWSPTA